MNEQRLLTEAELLAALNIDVDRTAVWRWRQQGMPHVKVGRSPRYDLRAVQAWLTGRSGTTGEWPWSVWTWVPEGRRPTGETEPAFWFEECRCRNQDAAENIVKMFQKLWPQHHARASTAKPMEPPETGGQPVTYPKSEEG